jgi:hypothetical protein
MDQVNAKVDYQYFFCAKEFDGTNGFFAVRTCKEVLKTRKADIEAILKARSENFTAGDWEVRGRKLRRARTHVVSVQEVPAGTVLSQPYYFWDGSGLRQLFIG